MEKKVTIHDIAREAGVSTATVSYIINDRPDKSISAETRQRVLHIINLYNYKPAAFAKNLRSSPDSKLIALFTGENESAVYGGEYQYFINNLSKIFPSDKYGLILSNPPYRRIEQADAIIAYNTDLQAFKAIAQSNYVPLIAVDCIPNDTLFFQITTDYGKLRSAAEEKFGNDYTFICLTPADDKVKAEAQEAFPNAVFVESMDILRSIQPQGHIVTADKVIYEYFSDGVTDVYFPENLAEDKCACILSCLGKVLQKMPFDTHFYKI